MVDGQPFHNPVRDGLPTTRPEPILGFPIAGAVVADQLRFMRRRRDSKRGWSRRLRKRNEPLMP